MLLGIWTKTIIMMAGVDGIFPAFVVQGTTIRKIVNLSQIFQFTRKKAS
jgi:hypothetical protein